MDDLRLKTVLSGLRATVCFDEFDFVTRVKVREIGKPPRDKYMSRGTQVGDLFCLDLVQRLSFFSIRFYFFDF